MSLFLRRLSFVLCAAPAFLKAASFHTPISITSPNSTALYPLTNLHQGSGAGYSAAAPHDAVTGNPAGTTWVTNAPGGFPSDYIVVAGAPVLIIDLGQNRNLTEISTWGYSAGNANGVSAFTLRFATAAEGTAGFGASIPGQGPFTCNLSDVTRHSHPLSPVMARYVEFTCTDNYYSNGGNGPPPGGDRVGLGEIAFEDGVPLPDPKIEMPNAMSLDLDGSVQSFNVNIHNAGASQPLNITSSGFTGTNAAAFTVISAPGSVAPGATEVLQFGFNPTGLFGNITATLQIGSNDSAAPLSSVVLTGFLHDPKLVVAGTFDFGLLAPGAPAVTLPLALQNAGGGRPLTLSGSTLGGADAARFSIVSMPAFIAPLGTAQAELKFDPAGEQGNFAAQLTLQSNDAANPSIIVNLTARVAGSAASELRINEFVAANAGGLQDGDGNRPDWIEIYNAGPDAVDLSGWHLTDRADNPSKWTFPSRVIGAGQYLVVFASGRNTANYTDPAGHLHTNFNLSAGGEYLALVMPDGATIVSEFHPAYPAQFNDVSYGVFQTGGSTTNLIASSTPSLLVPADGTLALTWTQRTFTPGAVWFNGTGSGQGVGYDTAPDYDAWISTDVQAQMLSLRSSAYMRYSFNVTDKDAIVALSLPIRYDDGFVAYLNGTVIASRNAPAAPLWNSLATGGPTPEPAVETIDVTAFVSALQNGGNVLAIHGMNQTLGSSDFLIAPEFLATTAGTGPLATGYMTTPTPRALNSGSSVPGPEIAEVTPAPTQPVNGQSTAITARVRPRLAPLASVTMRYRTDYGSEVAVPMLDNGAAGDAAAGDGIFSAIIPSSAYGPGDMLRWYVSATDTAANAGRAPAFIARTGTRQSPEYFGTVISDPAVVSNLPVFQWFTQNVTASHSAAGTRASVFFAGRFYDNVYVRQRGQATNGTVSQKFDFNKGEDFFVDATMPAVTEINLNGPGSDSTYVRQPLAFETFRLGGAAACQSALWLMRVNGGTDRTGIFAEQVDEEFLQRNDCDPDGDLYKMVQRSNLNPCFFDAITGIEKKTGNKSDLTSIQGLVAGLNQATSDARRRYVIDHLDLPQVNNYLALRCITQDADDVRKNFYVYQDSHGDRRWRLFPWDKDWTFGVTGDGGTWLPHPFFGDEEHAKQNANQWNVLFDVLFEETTTQRLYLRRLRTLMDTLLQPSTTPAGERILEARATATITPASPPLSNNISSITSYLTSRRTVLFNNYSSLIPASQPANPAIAITAADHNPASGDQDHEYIRLTSSEATEIDISGWKLTGATEFTFAPGTVIERGGQLYVSPDTFAFRSRSLSPTGNEERLVVGPARGHLSNFGETVELRNAAGTVVSSFTLPYTPSDPQLYLVVSEIMYHPEPDGEAEFVELMNISPSVTLNLAGVKFTGGIDFTFSTGTSLAPLARVLIVKNTAAFAAAHGPGRPVAGVFVAPSSLDNGGELIKLDDASGSTIREFRFNDREPWPVLPDSGHSLTLIRPQTGPDHADPLNWRASTAAGGTPGGTDALTFSGNPGADDNGDGIANLLAYALGLDLPLAGDPLPSLTLQNGRVVWDIPWNPAAEDVTLHPEWSADLTSWQPAAGLFQAETRVDAPGLRPLRRLNADSPVTGVRIYLRARAAVAP
jgi:hypothetical protein